MPPRVTELDAGRYGWGHYWAGNEEYLSVITLGDGSGRDTYVWGDCLYPENGVYLHVSSLDPVDSEHPDWATAYISVRVVMPIPPNLPPGVPNPDRNVTWGSFLDRLAD